MTHLSIFAGFGLVRHPLGDLVIVLEKVVQMDIDIFGLAIHGAHGVAKVAVVAKKAGILVQAFELFGRACAAAVEIHTVADGEVLVAAADDGAESGCCYDCTIALIHDAETSAIHITTYCSTPVRWRRPKPD